MNTDWAAIRRKIEAAERAYGLRVRIDLSTHSICVNVTMQWERLARGCDKVITWEDAIAANFDLLLFSINETIEKFLAARHRSLYMTSNAPGYMGEYYVVEDHLEPRPAGPPRDGEGDR